MSTPDDALDPRPLIGESRGALTAMARALGMNVATLHGYLSRRRRAPVDAVVAISEYVGMRGEKGWRVVRWFCGVDGAS